MLQDNTKSTEDDPIHRGNGDLEPKLLIKELKELEELHGRNLTLLRICTFVILLIGAILIPSIIFMAVRSGELHSLRIVIAVASGIAGLEAAAAIINFAAERQQRRRVNELRASEREFFDRLKRGLSSRLTEKAL